MEEKEKLLNVVNNMQIQTQNNLDSEFLKNAELTKQIAQQKHIISKQIDEIAQLNQFVIQRKKERRSLYSSPLQTSNKQMNQQNIMPITSVDYYQKVLEEECKREDLIMKLWKKLQKQSIEKVKTLQEALDYYLIDQCNKYEEYFTLQTEIINKLEDQLNKYKVALKLIIQENYKRPISELIAVAQSLNQENEIQEFDYEQLIETLIDFSNKRDLLYQLQQQETEVVLLKNKANNNEEYDKLNEQYNKLQEEYKIIDDQRKELLSLSQQMNDKITLQSNQINSMNEQIAQLTSLFAKSLQDLETVQEENETLKKCQSNFTTRTSEVHSRFSVGLDDKLIKCFNSVCSNYNSQSTRHNKSKNKSMLSQLSKSTYGDGEELCNLLDQVLNQGFSLKIIESITQLSNTGLRKRIKDLLFTIYNNNNEMDTLFNSFSTLIQDLEIPFNNFEIINEGFLSSTCKLEHNTKQICELLHHLVNSNNKKQTTKHCAQQIGLLSKVLLQLCQGNDDTIVEHIDKHIEISKQLKDKKNKQLRDLQFSACKMIMDIFKKWKQNYIHITTILYSIQRGLQQDQEIHIQSYLNELTKSDLGKKSRVQLALREIAFIRQSLSSKKKYIPMKDALNNFQRVLEENKKNNVQEIPRAEIQKCLIPAQGQLRSAKFHISFISFLLKLINLKVINDIQMIEDVLDYFLKIKDIQKEELYYKLIQSFNTFVHSDFINFGNFSFVEKCLTLVLYMKNSKIPIIHGPAATSLQRLIELLSESTQLIIAGQGFDEMNVVLDLDNQQEQNQQQMIQPIDHSKEFQNLHSMLSDLIKLIDNVKPHWYPLLIPLDREFGLISINNFLSSMGKFFLQYKTISELLTDNLILILKKIITTPLIKSSLIIETFKCLKILVENEQSEVVWNILINQIKQNEHSINKNLAFQTLIYFVQNQVFLNKLVQLLSNEKNIILEIITTLSNLAKEVQEPSEVEQKRLVELAHPTINLVDNSEVYPSDNGLVCRMLSEFQSRFVNSLCVYADQQKIQLGNLIKLQQNDKFNQLIELTWKHNLRAIKYLLLKELDEQTLQNLLVAFQQYINIVGSIQMKSAQSAFIKTICEFCKPMQGYEFAKKHIQINKMVLNIANCLGNLLECSSWICIFKTFEECENHYLRNRLAKNSSQEEQIKTFDITILFQSLDQLFSQSPTYGNEHLITVMDAINQITIECLEQQQIIEQKKTNVQFGEQKKYFSLSKLVELIKFNVFRLDVFWELIIAHFISVISSRNTNLVLNAADTLSQIIFYGFEYLTKFYKKNQQQQNQQFIKDKWSNKESLYQQTLFQPWLDMCTLRLNDIKEIILNNILKMIQNNGHEISNKGWDSILTLLLNISSEQTTIFVKQGLGCTEQIINQFLSNLDGKQIFQLFDIIDNFKSNSNEQNINFQICNMLWHLGDYITKNNSNQEQGNLITNEQLEMNLKEIFQKLSIIALDPIPEIRHSAIHIYSNLLIHLNSQNQYLEWKKILEEIFLELMHKIIQVFQDKNQAKELDVQQWEETVKSVYQAFVKLVKKYFVVIEESSPNKDQDIEALIRQSIPDFIIVFQQNKPLLSMEATKQLRELFLYQPIICLQNFEEILNQISEMFNFPSSDIKYLKTVILHITPDVLELLNDILKLSKDILIEQVIDTYYKILEFPLIAHMKIDLIQNKIFFEDNLAPKQILITLSQTLPKQSPKLIQRIIYNIKELIKDPPNDKYKHMLLKRHFTQFNMMMDNNIQLFFQFSELYEYILITMRNNDQYIYYSELLNEDKSIYMMMAENYLQRAKIYLQTNKEDSLKILSALQQVLPDKLILDKQLGQNKILQNENQSLELYYIELITEIYRGNPQLSETSEFQQFIQKLHEMSANSQIAINKLCLLSQNQFVIPYLLDASQKILERGIIDEANNQKIILDLLNNLQQISIPDNSFLLFQQLSGDFIAYPESSLLQSVFGHLFYLMPQMVQIITHKSEEVRIKVKEILEQISQIILKQQLQK
ncbi:unnamed protein product [Paramecium primaurelia]|uniref:Uncharacterized protein n=1 Tax=Paramecium primaurelia TaxID=5886 RepID=A0A8S1NYI9_PARPR|nr:unnamed protein product [Paramecium primaurelia]